MYARRHTRDAPSSSRSHIKYDLITWLRYDEVMFEADLKLGSIFVTMLHRSSVIYTSAFV